ncbi:hypothetical protein R1flu_005911 [Riccia fluitans]|uniref:plant cystathionine gamma-synthase n=1 Tax=Riccia fluitans TaxID=41844 RepID=A0ABD1YYI4_9MARC
MAAMCSTLRLGASSFGISVGGGAFVCRPDPSGTSSSSRASILEPSSSRGPSDEYFASDKTSTQSSKLKWSLACDSSTPNILRFPPNFVRQLSIKARRNCGNIGVAQVVAASATDLPHAVSSETAAATATADLENSLFEAGGTPGNKPLVNGVNYIAAKPRSCSTTSVHGGERHSRAKVTDALTTPIVQTSTYTFRDTAELIAFQEGTHTSFEYGRYGNPTTFAAESKISALEGAETTLLSASGMCAATTMLLALVPAGGHIVTTTDCYRRTRQFIQTVLPKMGITTTVIDPSDIAALERALDQHTVSLFFSESPTNPYLRCIDIELVSKLCHSKGALVCIDGTFATPVNQKALALGADIVLHSATKYLAGHNDVLAGSVSGSKECIAPIRALHHILGGVLDPNSAYLILRGMKTLELRVRQQNASALKLAQALEAHPKVMRVHYPGLESHPEHLIAKRQMIGFGGVISFEIAGGLDEASKFIDGLKIPYIAPSLGGCESLVEQPTIISYWDQSAAQRAKLGIKDNLVRFSCGIEDYEDIYNDMMQSLAAL